MRDLELFRDHGLERKTLFFGRIVLHLEHDVNEIIKS